MRNFSPFAHHTDCVDALLVKVVEDLGKDLCRDSSVPPFLCFLCFVCHIFLLCCDVICFDNPFYSEKSAENKDSIDRSRHERKQR